MDPYNQYRKILIVEDEPALLQVLVDTFNRQGFIVSTGSNGEEGFSRALSEKPDIVLLDIVMPKMDGMTMLKKLRKHSEWGKCVPVILLTNLSTQDEGISQEVIENEPSHYLVKTDWSISDVLEKVYSRLRES